ncbi:CehA/McbA family metallohydrolase domain-containing protein [Paenibacillus arenilitoris]|uniref:Polymerase/histidinol phosphatase N-terminal domain-containing protein n=1 Tax=Paenibacillus arenilitoris TaxID=2772299 RepID=A0A927H5W0_9BACL|nr:hypothetical protein [Paenibacillus arenilitoris]MBD2868953.1 hypothetical protein [Paenibacillus arenilitoris]
MRKSQFIENGTFFKGNIHSHTTRSDGFYAPAKLVEMYKERGYSFLVLSDHEKFFDSTEFDDPGFLVYPGLEWSAKHLNKPDQWNDLQGLFVGTLSDHFREEQKWGHDQYLESVSGHSHRAVQRAIDCLREAGHLSIYNHPRISRVEPEEILGLEGLFALEIYNHKSEVYCGNGTATFYWDWLLRKGKRLYGVADDDNHNQEAGNRTRDSFGGWIMVKARELSRSALAEALIQGSFYSSTGPEIYEYGIDDGMIKIVTSPVQSIRFITDGSFGQNWTAEDGTSLTEASYSLTGKEVYVRVECMDAHGKVAWSNPIFEENLPGL